MGGAILVSGAQSAFTNTLLRHLPNDAPQVDPIAVITAGATGLRDKFSIAEIPKILISYMAALRVTYTISIASAGMATLVAICTRWTSIKGKAVAAAA